MSDKKPIALKRTVKMEKRSKEGLLTVDGKTVHDDSWLHSVVLDSDWDSKHNASLKRSFRKSVELYLDLEKGKIDTTKLVKKPVQVHGEDGKVFTRMQWVDPNTGQPVTQKTAIDSHVKTLSTEEKYKMIDDHKIQWKHNDHPSILHKNKVEALKQHLYKNPHIVGAEHLPADDHKTPDGTDKVNEWANSFAKNDREKLYELMSKFGIAEIDPKIADPDDKAHPIKHMHNMMKFKKYLQDNPHYMDDPEHQPRAVSTSKPTSAVKTTAEKGGNTIDGVLKTMGRQEVYKLMKAHGIAEVDPLIADPTDKAAPIKHMHNMTKLKKLIELNPSMLNRDEHHSLTPHEQERRENMNEEQKQEQGVKDLLDGMSTDLKSRVADRYADHPYMKSRIKSSHAHVDNMHKISALKRILLESPEEVSKVQKEAETEQLMGLTIGNKNMGKVLRHFLGFKGVGDVKNVEPGIEWAYETGFVRREKDDEGKPILSVVDTGKDGDAWDEHIIDLSKVKEFLKGPSILKSILEYDIINWRW
ncbi:hypothetical protein D1872_50720 [compost metagenome]